MHGYSRSKLITDLGLVLVTAAVSSLLDLTLLLDDKVLSWFFRFMLYIIDFSILLAVEVTLQLKDGIAILHFFRVFALALATSYAPTHTVLVPALGYALFRAGSMAVNVATGLSQVDPRSSVVK
jgi:hypothetical protein